MKPRELGEQKVLYIKNIVLYRDKIVIQAGFILPTQQLILERLSV